LGVRFAPTRRASDLLGHMPGDDPLDAGTNGGGSRIDVQTTGRKRAGRLRGIAASLGSAVAALVPLVPTPLLAQQADTPGLADRRDRKSTRLNSSHAN